MADFGYLVIDKSGKEKKGSIVAESMTDAKALLKNEGFTIVELNEAGVLTKDINISFGGSGVKIRDLSVFCRQIVSMINAGVTIIDALEMLSLATENKTMAKTIVKVKENIQKGETLSESMAKYPKVFPPIMVSMVAAGEASGKLDVAFSRMAERFEKKAKMDAILKKAAIYPVMVMIIAVIVIIVMLVKIVPTYTDIFAQLGTDLPPLTVAAVKASDFLIEKWYLLLIGLIVVIVALRIFSKTISGQIFFGNLARKLPVFGKINVKGAASNYARTLSTLVYAGLSMVDAITITANTMQNYIYKESLLHAKDEVMKGVPLSEPIVRSGLFPPMVGYMTRIGEETGDIEGMLNKLADYYDEEVEMSTQSIMAALEPMIILVLAAIVVLLIAVIMGPMLKLYGSLQNL